LLGQPGDGAGDAAGSIAFTEGRVDQSLEVVEVHDRGG
ncbi:MAG: hypothetical protein QOE00_81, partial [Ilumatobacteraceae bacterium]